MRTTEFTEHDRTIIAVLKRPGDRVEPSFLVRQAATHNASLALLEYSALHCLDRSEDGYTCLGLPYIPILVELRGREFARTFVEHMCLTDQYNSEDGDHRQAFWRDERAWDLYDDADALVNFILKLTKYDAACILSSETRAQIDRKLRDINLRRHSPDQTAEIEQTARSNRTKLILIESAAVQHLDNVRSEYQFEAVLRQSRKEQISCSERVYPNGMNLVLMGYVMALYPAQSTWAEHNLHRYLESYPDKAVAVYRWLAEGFRRAAPNYWDMRIEDSRPRRMLESRGWTFVRLSATPQGYLQARITGRGTPIILRHQPLDGETPLKAGDEVMFHSELLTGLVPKNMPGMRMFTLSLPPAAPPTAAALANEMGYFYAGYRDDVLVDPYRLPKSKKTTRR
jgi:hypothetical protein